MTADPPLPTVADVSDAAARIAPHVRHTPLLAIELDGRRAVLKLEHLQLGGSFKLRGALNVMLSDPAMRTVVTASGGNHGLGVATAAALLGRVATIFVPETIPESKARRITATGAELIRRGATYAHAAVEAQQLADELGCRYLPAYDDPLVVAGQGTVAAEVVAAAPEVDSFVVAVGGAGLAAGCALVSRGRGLVAVEPTNCRSLHDALAAGRPVDSPTDSVAASALGATRVGTVPFGVLRSYPLQSVLVSDAELLAGRDQLWGEYRLAVEPAAGAAFAAWTAGRVPGELPCIVLCGANTEWTPE